jgi:hypothetical protein
MKNIGFPLVSGLISLVTFYCISILNINAMETQVKGAVLERGQSVQVTNKNGTVKISYISPTKRNYEWDGQSRIIKMIPGEEDVTDPLGSVHPSYAGMYNPADVWIVSFKVRLVVSEGTMNFKHENELYKFLDQGSAIMDWVYTSDGLAVGFARSPGRQQINFYLYQLLLNGKKPTNLKGANPNKIRLTNSYRNETYMSLS